MRLAWAAIAVVAISGCESGTSAERYICPNGPDLVVQYTPGEATVIFPNGRSESLEQVDVARPDFYAGPGITWDASQFRTARLTDGRKSFLCDQLG